MLYLQIKKLRTEKGYTQAEIAQLINKEQSAYSRLENGASRLSIEDAFRIAAILDCKVDDLFKPYEKKPQIRSSNKSAQTQML
jgi:transcriptional regulator with XRE-family HTH domain